MEADEKLILFEGFYKKSLLHFFEKDAAWEFFNSSKIQKFNRGEQVKRSKNLSEIHFILNGDISICDLELNVEVERLGSGKSIELNAHLNKLQNWQFNWISVDTSMILVGNFEQLEKMLNTNGTVHKYLRRISRSFSLQKLRRDLFSFGISSTAFVSLVSDMEFVKLSDLLNREKEEFYYLIGKGELVLKTFLRGRQIELNTFRAGEAVVVSASQLNSELLKSVSCEGWVLPKRFWSNPVYSENFFGYLSAFSMLTENFTSQKKARGGSPAESNLAGVGRKKEKSWQASLPRVRLFELWSHLVYRVFGFVPEPGIMSGATESEIIFSMVSNFLGFRFDPTFTKRDKFANKDFQNILNLAEESRFNVKVMPKKDLLNFRLRPVIGILNGRPLIIFQGFLGSYLALFADGTHYFTEDIKSLVQKLEPEIIHLNPNWSSEGNVSAISVVKTAIELVSVDWYSIFLLNLSVLLAFLCALLLPLGNQILLDDIISGTALGANALIGVSLVGISFISALLKWTRDYFSGSVSKKVEAFAGSYLTHSLFLRTKRSGRGAENYVEFQEISEGLRTLSALLVSRISTIPATLILIFLTFSCLFLFNKKIGFIGVFIFTIYTGLSVVSNYFRRILALRLVNNQQTERAMFHSIFDNIGTLRATGGEAVYRWRWENSLSKLTRNRGKLYVLQLFEELKSGLINDVIAVVTIVVGSILYSKGELSLAMVVVFIFLFQRLLTPSFSISDSVVGWVANLQILEKISKFTLRNRKTAAPIVSKTPVEPNGSFVIKNAARSETVDINDGEMVAIVGPSRSGKTILAKAIGNLELEGKYHFVWGGTALDSASRSALVRSVSYIEPDSPLFSGLLVDNITMDKPDIELNDVIDVSQTSTAFEFIRQLPAGFDTVLADGGVGLSEGQRQKVILARALFRNPHLLVLDEAMNHLDSISESIVISNLRKVKNLRVVYATQRINQLANVDKIIFLENEEIAEVGTHAELLKRRGKYWAYFCNQVGLQW